MIYQLLVPGPIEDVDEIRILEWHGEAGRPFGPGEMVVELETHKAVVEVRTIGAAILRRVLSQPGDWQKVGQAIALFSDGPDEELQQTEAAKLPVLEVEFEMT